MTWQRRAPSDHPPVITAVLSFTSAQLGAPGRIETVRSAEPANLREAVLTRVQEIVDEAGEPMRLQLTDRHGETTLSVHPALVPPARSPLGDSAPPVPPRRRRYAVPMPVGVAAVIAVIVVGGVLVGSEDVGDAATPSAPATRATAAAPAPESTTLVTPASYDDRTPRTVARVRVHGGAGEMTVRIVAPARALVHVTVVGPSGRVVVARRLAIGPTPRDVRLDALGPGEYRWQVAPAGPGRVRGGTVTVRPPRIDTLPADEPTPTTAPVPVTDPVPAETPYVAPTDAGADDGDTGNDAPEKQHDGGQGSLIGDTGPIDPDE
ncbi:hypothetical protein FXB39_01935 [Nocardioides sp. BGMRC 2183]|nr:hypothetical protein FXB39_01935 [Nocardioides sp. BGMRC 2183]